MTTLAFGQTYGDIFAAPGSAVRTTLSIHDAFARAPRHVHENDYLCFVVAGGFRERTGRGSCDLSTGNALLHRGGDWHEDSFGPDGARCLNLHLPASSGWRLDGPWRPSLRARLLVDALAAEAAMEGASDPLASDGLAAELLAALWSATEKQPDGAWLDQLIAVLSESPGRAWSLAELAALVGRHPTHVARAFRSKTGLSIGMYRRRRRVAELCLRLRRSRTALADLAVELGYSDQAHMSRELRGFTGMTPAAYRRAAR
jgi:AraC family transcriptional regulator